MKTLLILLSSFAIASLRSPLRGSIRFAMLAVSLCSALVSSFAAEQRPNILFLLSDDHSYPFLSTYGSPNVKTPVVDQLAAGHPDDGTLARRRQNDALLRAAAAR